MSIKFLELVALVAIIHCFVLSWVILLSKFFRNDRNKYLGFTLLIMAVVGMNNWFWDLNTNPLIINILDLFLWQFLYPITFFIFFYKTAQSDSAKTGQLKFLYLPFLVLSMLNIILSLDYVFHLYNLSKTIETYVSSFYKGISFLSIVVPLFAILFSYEYAFLKGNTRGKWLKHLWIFLSLLLLYGVILECYRFMYSEKLPLTYLWSLGSIFIYWLIYHGLYRFKLSNDQYEIRTILKKTKGEALAIESKENPHFQKLIAMLAEEKVHRNPNLGRDTLAEELKISSGYLTQIIKQNTGYSFTELINSYRVKDAKEMIKNPMFDKYSLLSIGLECGFNSKTSFFSNFKKETDLTPKQYRDK
ncbi:helix-turn-helix domain-containing protein [Flagellimonas sp.]|uniref:helix-turn-helix domain-containing protein n=1 Tax=Flagellimonas sp. TaxID=2058762 RepID=UPI003B5A8066